MRATRCGLPAIATLAATLTTGLASPPAHGDPSHSSARSADVAPLGLDGRPLNLDFETGTLDGWVAEGDAFSEQPIAGDTVAARRGDMRSQHEGKYWIGTYERGGDEPQGRLTSAPFRVTHPWATFLVAGGQSPDTRVELVRRDSGTVIFTATGRQSENLEPVAVDLGRHQGSEVFLRVIDEASGGWGHINFDHFRFHAARPSLPEEQGPAALDQFAHAGLSPADAARAMTVPEGFEVALFAGEPDVVQPIAMAIDDRGRLWIAEAYSYPVRVPDAEARDRILIFEDRDGDGRFDERKVFVEGLNLVSGLEVGYGGVWVGAAPQLLFIADVDGDDRPDGPPQVLLDGWGHHDTHETLNSFIWGPDGWLYGCHGVFTHSLVGKPGDPKEKRQPLNAGIWRYHPQRHAFEVFAHGTSNPWGVDFDDYGRALCTACVIPHLFHVIQGGRYQRQAGEHFNRHTYADIKTIADHVHWVGALPHAGNNRSDAAGGGHAHCGAMIYLGDRWPAEYRGRIFMSNIHGARLNTDLLEPAGSGLVGRHGPDFLLAHDAWSQIVNLQTGPDGQMYLIDWYDKNQCHRHEVELHDRTNGRIFKVSYRPEQNTRPPLDLAAASDEQLAELALDPDDWHVRHARRILAERGANPALGPRLEKIACEHADPTRRLRGLWALAATGNLDETRIARGLDDDEPHVRGWTIQLALDGAAPSGRLIARLQQLAASDPSPVVRLYLASAAQRIEPAERWRLLEHLTAHREDAGDHNLPLMYWYALEPLVDADPRRALALAAGSGLAPLPGFTVRRIASGGSDEAIELLVASLGGGHARGLERAYLEGITQALRGRRQVPMPPSWPPVSRALLSSGDAEVRRAAVNLAVTFGDQEAIGRLQERLADSQAAPAERLEALETLLAIKDPQLAPRLLAIAGDRELAGSPLLAAALRGLAGYESPRIADALLEAYPRFSSSERRDALATLASRAASARKLLDGVEAGRVPRGDITAEVIRQLRNLRDKALLARVGEVWGVVRDTPADKARQINEYKRLLGVRLSPPPDPAHGRAVFAKVCQQCHKLFGTGGDVGPELTGSNRADLDYLLSNVLDPSAVMANQYMPTIVATSDGRIITGLVREENEHALSIVTANETLVVPKDEIETRQPSQKSMMPDDLLAPLRPDEIRALVAYLASPQQVPLLATPENAAGLFNGRDLAGWTGNPELWSVVEGQIVGRSSGLDRNAFLVSELSAGDFRLSLEVLLVDDRGNSGIQFRSQPLDEGEVRGYQADVGPGWWGKLYEEHGRGMLWEHSGEAHVRRGEWNRYEIVAEQDRVRTWINGQLCVDMRDPPGARRGVFALQLHSGEATEVRFRDLKLELLPEGASR